MNRTLLIIVGWISVILALAGSVLPLVPAFPFVFLAGYCFMKSSKKLHQWFVETRLYKYNIETYVEGRKLRMQTKLLIVLGVSFTSIYGFYVAHHLNIDALKIILVLVWITNVVYFMFVVKTAPAA